MHQYVSRRDLVSLRRRALRTGKWFRLNPLKRAALEAAIRALQVVRCRVLLDIFRELLELVSPERARLERAYEVGLKIARVRVKQALALGYRRAREWLGDRNFIIQLGLAYLSLPRFYRSEL